MCNCGSYVFSKTDERAIYDFPLPGVKDEQIGIFVRPEVWDGDNGAEKGHDFTVKVRGKPEDEFGFNHYVVTKLTETVKVSVEFNLEALSWTFVNGVLRISIPREDFSVGVKVDKSEPTPTPVPPTEN